jgi:glycosyltransferase involved in cell wall biosynthesis
MHRRRVGVSSSRQRRQLAERIAAAGLAPRADILGFVTEADLAWRQQNACLLLYLSLYEGFGLPVLEAVAGGVPVIASDCSSLPELLPGAPGLMSLEQPEAIESLIVLLATDHSARRDFLQAQRRVLPHFDWARTAERYLQLFGTA